MIVVVDGLAWPVGDGLIRRLMSQNYSLCTVDSSRASKSLDGHTRRLYYDPEIPGDLDYQIRHTLRDSETQVVVIQFFRGGSVVPEIDPTRVSLYICVLGGLSAPVPDGLERFRPAVLLRTPALVVGSNTCGRRLEASELRGKHVVASCDDVVGFISNFALVNPVTASRGNPVMVTIMCSDLLDLESMPVESLCKVSNRPDPNPVDIERTLAPIGSLYKFTPSTVAESVNAMSIPRRARGL